MRSDVVPQGVSRPAARLPSPSGFWLRIAITFAVVLAIVVSAQDSIAAEGQETKHVLVIHSYNQGLTWTDSEDAGIRSVLRKRVADVDVHTEYLDTKRISSEAHFRRVAELMKQKYKDYDLDVVITTDDDAYNFAVKYHDVLFPGVPVVFCGVNYLRGTPPFATGVVEAYDVAATLKAAFDLQPAASRVVVINDATTTGEANKQVITETVIPEFSDRAKFVFLEDLTMGELLERVSRVPPDDIILLMSFNRDRAGQVFSYDQSIALISESARAPMYGVWDFYLGKGIVGGALVTGREQGRIAGTMAQRVLDGTPVSDIPVDRKSTISYEFDYRQMQRFGFRADELPPGSRIVNKPPSFYSLHRGLVWGVGLGFLGLVTIIALLLVYIRLRIRSEAALGVSEEKYRTLLNNLSAAVARTTPSGRYIQVNPAMARIFGYESPEQLMESPITDLYQDLGDRERLFEELRTKREVKNLELPMKRRDGTPVTVSLSVTPQFDERGAIKWVDSVLEDITARKRAEEELHEKDVTIRQAYTDVIDAATGGKLVLMTEEEIFDALGEIVLPAQRVDSARDLSEDRRILREALESLTPPPRVIDEYVLAASEAMTNVLKHGVDGEVSVRRTTHCAQVVVADFGPGIDFRSLPKATLVPGFSTKQTLGMGFTIMLGVADRVLLATRPSLTVVVLEVGLR